MPSIIVHGHFYQPPRENPWTGAIDREESARPFHDWNERIHSECYRANAFARIVNSNGLIERIVNNYANLSFNFGPTLMRWLDAVYPETSARIVAADRLSRERHGGHGSAIAQAYNHAILPLCNQRDLHTQIRWGLADFRHRFGREAEAMWLPETACNDTVMSALIDAQMKYVILSPHQAERARPLDSSGADAEWKSVADGSIDPRKPYRYLARDGFGRSLAVFFYDDGIARAIAFENLLWSSEALVDRLVRGAGDGALVNVATDGESYGHHFKFGDRCLAYALEVEAAKRGITVTNYGEFLARNPPQDIVEIKAGPGGEGTAWSCSHGVGRWCRNCGCNTGGQPGWNQEWRAPLRAAFDLVRDACAMRFEEMGAKLFRDPWAARDAFIEVILDRAAHDSFLAEHARYQLEGEARLRALTLLDMQRNAMLMYTSCGWFFTELSGIETVQTMKYAGRTLDLMESLGMRAPRDRFLEILGEAKSNLAEMGNGADVFRRFVAPSRVTPMRLAAHLAISRLADHAEHERWVGDYFCREEDLRHQKSGQVALATSRVTLRNSVLDKRDDFACAALHLGGADFYCALKEFAGSDELRVASESVWAKFPAASLPDIIRAMRDEFGRAEFGLDDLLTDGRLAISAMIFNDVLEGFSEQFARLYEDFSRMVEMLRATGFEPPPQFRQLAEFTLARRFEAELQRQQQNLNPPAYKDAIAIAELATKSGYRIDITRANERFTAMIDVLVRKAVEGFSRAAANQAIEAITLSRRLGLEPNIDAAQELVYRALSEGGRNPGQLARLAGALGLAHVAVRRHKPAARHRPQDNGAIPPRSLVVNKSPRGSRRRQPRDADN